MAADTEHGGRLTHLMRVAGVVNVARRTGAHWTRQRRHGGDGGRLAGMGARLRSPRAPDLHLPLRRAEYTRPPDAGAWSRWRSGLWRVRGHGGDAFRNDRDRLSSVLARPSPWRRTLASPTWRAARASWSAPGAAGPARRSRWSAPPWPVQRAEHGGRVDAPGVSGFRGRHRAWLRAESHGVERCGRSARLDMDSLHAIEGPRSQIEAGTDPHAEMTVNQGAEPSRRHAVFTSIERGIRVPHPSK